MKYKEKEILEILWIDSIHDSGWKEKNFFIKEGDNKDWIWHKTIGYFLLQDDEILTVMQSYTKKGGLYNTDARMSIPKCSIKKIRRIK